MVTQEYLVKEFAANNISPVNASRQLKTEMEMSRVKIVNKPGHNTFGTYQKVPSGLGIKKKESIMTDDLNI